MQIYLIMDVESVGLHGEGFAVGYVVCDETGYYLEQGIFLCDSLVAHGCGDSEQEKRDRSWLERNCLPYLPSPTHPDPRAVRDAFWNVLTQWKAKRATFYADVGWPVEARFLARCVDDAVSERQWEGPFPLQEVATATLLASVHDHYRRPDELPAHNPLNDSRKSARYLVEALRRLKGNQ